MEGHSHDLVVIGSQGPALEVSLAGGGRERLRGGHYVIATGSAPWIPDVPGLRESGYLTSDTAMELEEVPDSLLIVGGGFVAVEQAQLFGARDFRASKLLVATGRRGVTAGLNLTAVGVRTGQRGEVLVDAELRTANPRIWAAGDVTDHPEHVYVAASHGSIAAENALAGAARTVGYDRGRARGPGRPT